jgi:hypothetical protein
MAVGLNGALGHAQRVAGLLVGLTANDKLENFPLAGRQLPDTRANQVQLAVQATRPFMMRDSPFNCPKKRIRRYGLGQKIVRTRFNGPHSGRNIGVASEEDDGQGRAKFAKAILEFWSAQSRYPHVEEDAAQFAFARQAIEQILGRRIGRDLVASLM